MKYRGQKYNQRINHSYIEVKTVQTKYRGVLTFLKQSMLVTPRRKVSLKYRGVTV
ncbi:MAG: DUF4278 domain-containing protein [Cyanobacteria bacterium P01_H01_bin.15]